MTNKWEKVHSILTVIALLICFLYGMQWCFCEYQDYVEALSLKDVVSSTYRQEFFHTRYFRQAMFTGIDTLIGMALIILVSRFMYIYLERRVPEWRAEDARENAPDTVNVSVRVIHEGTNQCPDMSDW